MHFKFYLWKHILIMDFENHFRMHFSQRTFLINVSDIRLMIKFDPFYHLSYKRDLIPWGHAKGENVYPIVIKMSQNTFRNLSQEKLVIICFRHLTLHDERFWNY